MVSAVYAVKIRLKQFLKNNLYLSYILLKMLYFRLRFHRIQSPRSIGDKTDILFSTYLMNWRRVNAYASSPQLDDVMLGDVMESTSQYFRIASLDEDPHHRFRNYEKSLQKFSRCDSCFAIEDFINIKLILRAYILSFWSLLGRCFEHYEEFLNITDQHGKMNAFFQLLLAEKILSGVRPNLVFLSCEYGVFHRTLTYVTKKNCIPVVALQHGVITPAHPGYILKDRRFAALLPDLTCVYGRHYRDILVKQSIYTDEMVAVTGSPRYDFLHSAVERYSREDVLKRFEIPESNKLILWTTQTHGLSMVENKANLSCIFRAMSELNRITLVIKQHPGETKKDTMLIKEYIQRYHLDNVVLAAKDSDTYELIFACDLMITRHSTTALEAIALDKPVIVLNLTKEPDPVDYADEGVALGVRRAQDLKSAIEKLLKDDSDLANNRAKYIEMYLYRIDGDSTKRVLKHIRRMIEKKKKDY